MKTEVHDLLKLIRSNLAMPLLNLAAAIESELTASIPPTTFERLIVTIRQGSAPRSEILRGIVVCSIDGVLTEEQSQIKAIIDVDFRANPVIASVVCGFESHSGIFSSVCDFAQDSLVEQIKSLAPAA